MEFDFEQFLDAVRRGDLQAADAMARRLARYLRRVIHLRLTNRKLRQVLDSMDLCQSVLAFFFANAHSRWLKIESEEDLQRLLVAMADNKLKSRARHEDRRLAAIPERYDSPDRSPGPFEVALAHDLRAHLRTRFNAVEWWLFDQNRIQGRSWREIAQDGAARPESLREVSPDGLRIRLTRAIARVQRELRAGGADHA